MPRMGSAFPRMHLPLPHTRTESGHASYVSLVATQTTQSYHARTLLSSFVPLWLLSRSLSEAWEVCRTVGRRSRGHCVRDTQRVRAARTLASASDSGVLGSWRAPRSGREGVSVLCFLSSSLAGLGRYFALTLLRDKHRPDMSEE